MLLLALLPLSAFIVIFLVLIRRFHRQDWRQLYLRAAVLWGAYMVLETELLSFVRGVTPLGLALAWAVPVLAGGSWLIWQVRYNRKITFPHLQLPLHWAEGVLLLGVAAILGITALLAWVAPPQTWDSLNYHMPRVAHWAQEKAVRPFTTGIDVQNSMPPGAEMIILQVYVLAQSDRLANFVEWASMLGCLVAAGLIARQLGASRLGQILAVVAAASIPMGIAQASSTMTDTVVAFWVMCAAAEALPLLAGGSPVQAVPFASLAAGLALLTKPTAAAYILPVGIFIAAILIRKIPFRQFLKWGIVAILLTGAVNLGHWVRNFDLYGNPVSGAGRIAEHANGLITPGGVISNLLRNAALHTGVPWAKADRLVYEAVIQIHKWIQVDPNDPRTTSVGPYKVIQPSTSEQRAGNPIHALLIGIAFCLVLLGCTRFGRQHLSRNLCSASMLAYVLTSASTFLVFSLLYQWQIFGSRYHMPFFILFAPVTGLLLAELLPANGSRLAGMILIMTATPYLFSIDSRPLIAVPGRSLVGSVLKESPQRLLFANGLYLIKPYEDLTNRIKDVKCDRIGLAISGAGAEYPLWTLLGLPGKPRQIEWITTGPSTQFAKHDFQPCAIICEDCQQDMLKGLSLDYRFDTYRLYLNVP
jgi:hypothetical protein